MADRSRRPAGALAGQPPQLSPAAAARRISRLDAQAASMRVEIATLRRAAAKANRGGADPGAAQLREANEALVLATLRASATAETAAAELAALTRSSQRDELTGTPNRAVMRDRIETAIALARRQQKHAAILFVDLDGFKQVNDTLGHSVGDEVLMLTARRLQSVVRDSDTVSRYGGDEFVVLLAQVLQPPDAAMIAAKVLAALAAPSFIRGHELALSAAIGISIYPEDGEDAGALISGADAAMYRAKKRGTGFERCVRQPDAPTEAGENAQQGRLLFADLPPATATDTVAMCDLREANEQLVIAAVVAQELEARAVDAQRRHIGFLAMVAHELRNPLAPMRTAADLLERAGAHEPVLLKIQGIIRRQVLHMSRLVDDLLDGSRVSTGRLSLDRATVDLHPVLEAALDAARPNAARRTQHLSMHLPDGPLPVHGDAVRLAQIFNNLLDNASKYTPHGGTIALVASTRADSVTIDVRDDGIGITPDVLPAIFDLFVQDARAVAFNRDGLGIGLAVVRELVEAHGGTVTAQSDGIDRGSCFGVTLPLLPSPAPLH